MTDGKTATLIERIGQSLDGQQHAMGAAVPIDELPVFLRVAEAACAALGECSAGPIRLLIDAATAAQLGAAESLAGMAARCDVFGEIPASWRALPVVRPMDASGRLGAHDRALVLLGPHTALAMLGTVQDDDGFDGLWTADPETALGIAIALAGGGTGPAAEDPHETARQSAALAYRLMGVQAQALASRGRAAGMEKQDLVSVLEILKAISAKRRAHDILFVFVEQIARVVPMGRCSILRIWGSGRYGQVLASHEDATVHDRSIDLDKYPEIHHALAQRRRLVVDDVSADVLTMPHAEAMLRAHLRSLAVVPIVLFDENVGSLLLRAARDAPPFTPRELSFFDIVAEAASNALERAHLFESIQLANQRLEKLATTDGLTGIFNHRYFRERLNGEMERAFRYQLPLACILMDIDDFKGLNDTYGHLLGDSVLRELSQHVGAKTRKSDMLARYGGEEFVVLMPQTDLQGALSEAERIRAEIESYPFQGLASDRRVTVSMGVAALIPELMRNGDELLHAADRALYQAKGGGKNRVVAYLPGEDRA